MTDQNTEQPLRALTATYHPDDEAEQPHRVQLTLAASTTTFAFKTLGELQEFISGAQAALGHALGQAIAHQPEPKKIDEVDEKFLEETMEWIEGIKSDLDEIPVRVDLHAMKRRIEELFDYATAGDEYTVEVEAADVEYALEELHGTLHAKHESLYDARMEAEQKRKMLQEQAAIEEQKELAESAEQAGHVGPNGASPGGQTLQ